MQSWIQWLVQIIRKDMRQYQEETVTKQEVYRKIKRGDKYNEGKDEKEL